MSLRPRRPRKKTQAAPHIPLPLPDNPAGLVPILDMPAQRHAPYTRQFHLPQHRPVFAFPNGTSMTQIVNATAKRDDGSQHDTPLAVCDAEHHNVRDQPQADDDSNGTRCYEPELHAPAELICSTTRAKQEKQWQTWTIKIIPSLLPIFLRLLHETQSLRDQPRTTHHVCHCAKSGRRLEIVCVYFQRSSS